MRPHSHHLLFPRRLWEAQKPSKELRSRPELQFALPDDIHEALHRHIGLVPVLGYILSEELLTRYEPNDNQFRSVDNLLLAMNGLALHYRQRPIERDLLRLTETAVDLQRPYIRHSEQ